MPSSSWPTWPCTCPSPSSSTTTARKMSSLRLTYLTSWVLRRLWRADLCPYLWILQRAMLKSCSSTSSKNYTTVLDQWLLFLHNDGQCYNSYHNSIKLVQNAFHKLYLFVKASVNGQPAKLDDFQALCSGGACRDATEILLSGLSGGSSGIFPCDLNQILYEGVPGQSLQINAYMAKGWRDMVTPYHGFLLTYTAASMVVLSAYDSSTSLSVDTWRPLQVKYNGQLKLAIKKMSYLDQLMRDQMLNNAQTTVSRVFDSPAYYQSKNYNESLWTVTTTALIASRLQAPETSTSS
ncbi:hypothetical protein FGO68_gene17000 [Halteria grandinella]|uniref:Uncharacterized protein n=1 Tax=Halteria grandinella TaxID=5974 RepID=A0A8J8NZM7_HALGN|nr:hypothetical protein FGO68_gene17000 [Halteria grandinella]